MPRALEDWIASYIHYARNSEAPDTLHFWTAVSTIGGALRRKCYLPFADSIVWSPNFYIIFVAPPGVVTKSTTIGLGESLLSEIDGIHFGPNVLTWQYLPKLLGDVQEDCYINGSSTLSTAALSFFISELGTFLDPSDRMLIDTLVDMWDGKIGRWSKGTKAGGTESIFNPWINIIGGTTPVWIRANFPHSVVGGGFIARCIFIFATKKKQLVPHPFLLKTDEDRQLRRALIVDLNTMANLAGEFHLAPDAIDFGSDWYMEHWSADRTVESTILQDFAGRKQCHSYKLAMVLSASRGDDMLITRDDLVNATNLMQDVENSLPSLIRHIDTTPEMMYAEEIFAFVKRHKTVSKTQLFRQFSRKFKDVEQFNLTLLAGQTSGLVTITPVNGKPMVTYVEDDDSVQAVS